MEDSNLEFHHLSWIDPIGRLFWRHGNLYRGIRQKRAGLYRDLLAQGVIQELVQKKLLIDTWAVDWTMSEFPLILQHRVLPVVSFPSEWCASQLKAAALVVLDLEIALRAYGVTLVDINPWNMLFDGVHPLYVDFSSIAPLSEKNIWSASNLFNEFYLNPLLLFGKGLPRVARRLLCDPWCGVTNADLLRMGVWAGSRGLLQETALRTAKRLGKILVPRPLRPIVKKSARALLSRAKNTQNNGDALSQILALRDRVDALSVFGPDTQWGGYYSNNCPAFTPSADWTAKHHSIYNVIREVKPQTLLDLGANRGWYSQMAASLGVQVIATDSDETSVNELYSDARIAGLSILSIFMDVRFPEPAQGPGYKLFEPAAHRFRSEMVLALAIVHHLAFTWDLSLEEIVEILSMFSSKWLVVEFVGPNDPVFPRLWKDVDRPWYNLDMFLVALGQYYNIVKRLPSDSGGLDIVDYGPDDRTILVCKKKQYSR